MFDHSISKYLSDWKRHTHGIQSLTKIMALVPEVRRLGCFIKRTKRIPAHPFELLDLATFERHLPDPQLKISENSEEFVND